MIESLAAQQHRATLDSVAELAGVSRATAGRVLAGSTKVSAQRSAAVHNAANQLGYTANRAARSLVTGRSDSIAIVISESSDRLFTDPFFAAILRGARRESTLCGVQLLLVVVSSALDREQFLRYAVGSRLDGVVLVSLHGEDLLPQQLREAGINVVLSGRYFNDAINFPYVDADNVTGGRLAARALISAGCERIASITGPLDMPVARDRLHGWEQELLSQSRPVGAVATAEFTTEGGFWAMHSLLQKSPIPDGVFCANDLIAIGAIQALTEAGLNCPQDLKIIGFDDSPDASNCTHPLTSVRQPMERLGKELAGMAIRISRNEKPAELVLLDTTVIHRVSC